MKVVFKPFDWKSWEINDGGDKSFHIEAYSHNRESEPVLIRIEEFTPWCYAELPDRNWEQHNISNIQKHLTKILGDDAPLKCVLTWRKKYYYYRGEKKYPLLLVSFKNMSALKHFTGLIKKPISLKDEGTIHLIARETSISQIKKLCSVRKINFISWIQAEAEEVFPSEEMYITMNNGFKHEYIVNWRDLEPVPQDECSLWRVNPTILSFDGEMMSFSGKSFPNALHIKDNIIMLGYTFERLNDISTRKKYLLVYGPHEPLEGVEVRCFNSELEMLNGHCDLINELNPDILIGHNIYGFDYNYMNTRLTNNNQKWKECARIRDRIPTPAGGSWSSSAYGLNETFYIQMDGRISIDTLPLIRRDFKLDKYTLDFCAKTFLKKSKVDIEINDMFRYFKLAHGWLDKELKTACEGVTIFPFLNSLRLHKSEIIEKVIKVFEQYKGTPECYPAIKEIYDENKPAVMAVVGRYCVQDTILPIELFSKLNSWISISELSSIVKVTIMESFTRGQQIRNLSQTYDLAYDQGYYLDERIAPKYPFVGAYVHHPIPGLYEDVISFDFASLYPSIIIAYNICPTTFIPAEIEIDESKCNIIEWRENGKSYEEALKLYREKIRMLNEDRDIDEEDIKVDTESVEFKYCMKEFMQERKYRFRFLKSEYRKGLLPQNLEFLISKRKATRLVMENEEEGSYNYNILNIRQNNYKVSANSGYGGLGASTSKIELMEGAMCVTALGRKHIHEVMEKVKECGGIQVYGDTDSCMVRFPEISREKLYEFGKQKAKEFSIGLPAPMKLEFERAYAMFFILTAKRYANVILRPDGSVETDPDKIYKKGIVLARRDNCLFLRQLYKDVLLCILYGKGFEEATNVILSYFRNLLSGKIPISSLTIIKSLNISYKSESNPMYMFSNRMRKMGKLINAGDRLEYVFVKTDNPKDKQGDRMMLPEILEANPGKYKLDYFYYIEKQLTKPIQQLMEIAYNVYPNFLTNIVRNFKNYYNVVENIESISKKNKSKLVIVRK